MNEDEMSEGEALRILAARGYNWALSDVEEACEHLDHPELTPGDAQNYHRWAEPYPRRCYCSAIAYTENGRVHANELTEDVLKVHRSIWGDHYPDGSEIRNRCGEPYAGIAGEQQQEQKRSE
jgi:hypothetical protein